MWNEFLWNSFFCFGYYILKRVLFYVYEVVSCHNWSCHNLSSLVFLMYSVLFRMTNSAFSNNQKSDFSFNLSMWEELCIPLNLYNYICLKIQILNLFILQIVVAYNTGTSYTRFGYSCTTGCLFYGCFAD